MVFKYLQNLCSAAFMLVSLWSILATSSPTTSIDQANLYLISDCVVPALESNISTAFGQIVAPIGRTYGDFFGFPLSLVNLQSPITGFASAVGRTRSCYLSYGDAQNGNGWVYSCYDNGAFSCSVMLKNQ